jgi:alanine-glyoxylate transaminase/serine-glyoxylate transaminase/serine-pyruvate transaminase
MVVQVDTSTIREERHRRRCATAMDAAGHDGAVDGPIASPVWACDELQMDGWGVDIMVTGSQKGLMTPPGMSFVFFNAKADAVRASAGLVTGYWDWRPRVDPQEFYRYFNGTAPTHHLYGLRVALDMILKEEGLEAVLHRHAVLARAIWAALEVWGPGRAGAPQHRRTATSAVVPSRR